MKYIAIINFLILIGKIHGQQLPANRRVNWSLGISHFSQVVPSNFINFYDAGADSTGLLSNDALMTSILNSVDSNGLIIYFPPGQYLFENTINLKSNVVFKGESPKMSNLIFDLDGVNDLISAQGVLGSSSSIITVSCSKDDTIITVNDASVFNVGDLIKLTDQDSDKISSTWAYQSSGQIVKIKAISSHEITLYSPLRRDFLLSKNPVITKINPIYGVGIENLSIHRLDATSAQTSHIDFNYSTNCYVKCIESYNANFAHIEVNNSSNCLIEGSYFQDAFDYGNGGKAYGIVLQFSTGESQISNNIFKHLRHAILLQAGANGNVISYNYVYDSYWTDVALPSNAAGDIVLHGNYPYCNLIEGNIVQNIVIDDSHGKNGHFNTFLRNRAEYYGIIMNTSAGDSMNFISNEITNTGFFLGSYYLTGTNHFQYGNNKNGSILPAGTSLTTDYSYYLNSTPTYYLSQSYWPPIGIISNYNTYLTESKTRSLSNDKTSCFIDDVLSNMNDDLSKTIQISPNPVYEYLNISNLEIGDIVEIHEPTGKKMIAITVNQNQTKRIDLSMIPAGTYFVFVKSKSRIKIANTFIKVE